MENRVGFQSPADAEQITADEPALPRFTLPQLFLGTTVFAVTQALVASIHLPESFDAPPPWQARAIISIAIGLVYSGPIAALVWTLLFGWRQGATFPREPGHWFLALLGLTFIERWATVQLVILGGPRYALPWPTWMYVWMAPWLVGAVMAFVAAYFSTGRLWRLCFVTVGALRVLLTVGAFLANLEVFSPSHIDAAGFSAVALVLLSKLLILIAYRRDHEPRSKLHRIGVYAAFEDLMLLSFACCCPIAPLVPF
jgi:hypothetical protein